MASFCYLHGKLPARAIGCPTCDQHRWNQPDDDGEALPAQPVTQRECEVCGREISYGSRCPRDDRDDLDPVEKMFGGLGR